MTLINSNPYARSRRRYLNLCVLFVLLALTPSCDSVVEPGAGEARSERIADIRLDFDLTNQSVFTTINPISDVVQGRSASGARGAHPLLTSGIIDPYLEQDTAWCDGCRDGVQGWHPVYSLLRNRSLSTLQIDSVGGATCSGCAEMNWHPQAAIVESGGLYLQSFNVLVNASKFSVSFSVWGEPL